MFVRILCVHISVRIILRLYAVLNPEFVDKQSQRPSSRRDMVPDHLVTNCQGFLAGHCRQGTKRRVARGSMI